MLLLQLNHHKCPSPHDTDIAGDAPSYGVGPNTSNNCEISCSKLFCIKERCDDNSAGKFTPCKSSLCLLAFKFVAKLHKDLHREGEGRGGEGRGELIWLFIGCVVHILFKLDNQN